MRYLLAIILLALTTCQPVYADKWTNTDTALQLTYTAVHIADWAQTRQIALHPDIWYEKNLILGTNPHSDKVDAYFALTLLGHTAIAYMLPDPYRNLWQGAWIGIESGVIYGNYIRAGYHWGF